MSALEKKEIQYLKILLKDAEEIKWGQIAKLMNQKFCNNKKATDYKNIWRKVKPRKKQKKIVWNHQQDKKLFQLHMLYGPCWKKFTQIFPKYSENNIKNRFFAYTRKKLRQICKQVGDENCSQKIENILPTTISNFLKTNGNQVGQSQIEKFISFILNFEKDKFSQTDLWSAKIMIDKLVQLNQINLQKRPRKIRKVKQFKSCNSKINLKKKVQKNRPNNDINKFLLQNLNEINYINEVTRQAQPKKIEMQYVEDQEQMDESLVIYEINNQENNKRSQSIKYDSGELKLNQLDCFMQIGVPAPVYPSVYLPVYPPKYPSSQLFQRSLYNSKMITQRRDFFINSSGNDHKYIMSHYNVFQQSKQQYN